ncbi:MAG: hypothetical protein IJV25_09255 [Prevotella sp.]|nr:hypothetical protein [Prevotella sp.]MBQ9650587.1 hypothetical protein [Prevotella sp.]
MKRNLLFSIVLAMLPMLASASVVISKENFPDDAFRAYVSSNTIDTNQDGQLSDAEIASVDYINIPNQGIKNLQGIEYFTSLKYLQADNNEITTLDLSKNIALIWAMVWNNALTSINVSTCSELDVLGISSNSLTSLDVTNNHKLTYLTCQKNQLKSLDVSKNVELDTLWCNNNQLATLDVSKNTKLLELTCWANQLTSLDVTHCQKLKSLECSDQSISALDLSKCPDLGILVCALNNLTKLDVSNNTALTEIYCYRNQLTTLDVSNLARLETLYCHHNQLTSLTVCETGVLKDLAFENNQIAGQAMDNLIASLPNQENGEFSVFNTDTSDGDEHNVCTTEQVKAANNKGWQCYHLYNDEWQPYAGSDPSAITAPQAETIGNDAPVYGLNGQRASDHHRGIVIRNGRKYVNRYMPFYSLQR